MGTSKNCIILFRTPSKKLLLEKKVSKVEWHYNNGKVEYKTSKATRFKQKSPLLGNVYSRPEAKNGNGKN